MSSDVAGIINNSLVGVIVKRIVADLLLSDTIGIRFESAVKYAGVDGGDKDHGDQQEEKHRWQGAAHLVCYLEPPELEKDDGLEEEGSQLVSFESNESNKMNIQMPMQRRE